MGRRPKDVYSYSNALWHIVERVATQGEVFEVPVSNVQTARKLRGKFYAFRQAIEAAIHEAMTPGSAHSEDLPRLQNMLQWSRVSVCWFAEGPGEVVVKYMSKDQTPDAEMYRQALASAKPAPPIPGEEEALEEAAKRVAEATSVPLVKKNPYY